MNHHSVITCPPALIVIAVVTTALAGAVGTSVGEETTVPVRFSGGHNIGKDDFGRPVLLIAAALKVKPEVFREAFRGVTPARDRGPTPEEARQNKAALLKILAPHGVTNERLDAVSDYYRFQPQRGELWPNAAAKAYAIVELGKIKRIVVTDPGHGYSSPPQVTVDGFQDLAITATLGYSRDFKKNGSVTEVRVVSSQPVGRPSTGK